LVIVLSLRYRPNQLAIFRPISTMRYDTTYRYRNGVSTFRYIEACHYDNMLTRYTFEHSAVLCLAKFS